MRDRLRVHPLTNTCGCICRCVCGSCSGHVGNGTRYARASPAAIDPRFANDPARALRRRDARRHAGGDRRSCFRRADCLGGSYCAMVDSGGRRFCGRTCRLSPRREPAGVVLLHALRAPLRNEPTRMRKRNFVGSRMAPDRQRCCQRACNAGGRDRRGIVSGGLLDGLLTVRFFEVGNDDVIVVEHDLAVD